MTKYSFSAGIFAVALSATCAHAAAFKVLYTFCSLQNCSDGQVPRASLIDDSAGNFYSTTAYGGAKESGEVFKLSPTGAQTVLYSFCVQQNCSDGAAPFDNVIMDKSGNLYGTTVGGGKGHGTVFKLAPNGTETVLYNFLGGNDGDSVASGLVMDKAKNLYGATEAGGGTGCGGGGCGTIFRIAPDGSETLLHVFSGGNDGATPYGSLLLKSGILYGTTSGGGGPGCEGSGCGTVYRMALDGTESVLFEFCQAQNGECTSGSYPLAGVTRDSSGNLYGTTVNGGQQGRGIVYKLSSKGAETVLYSFCALANCDDGENPVSEVTLDSSGNIFGTTQSGGSGDRTNCPEGCGTVYKLSPNGTETVLHAFCSEPNCADGGNNLAAMPSLLLNAAKRKLYGTTPSSGANFEGGTVYAVAK